MIGPFERKNVPAILAACSQKPSAIFSATSTEVDPLSEKNTCSSAGGVIATSRCASCSAGGCVKPAKMIWSSRLVCARIAAMIGG
jgi:hypothetical protein